MRGIVVMMVLESTTPCSGVMVFQHRSCLAIPLKVSWCCLWEAWVACGKVVRGRD